VDVRVAGHQVETGESLRDEAQRRVEDISEKYFARATSASVTFGRGPNGEFTCDIVAPVRQGVVLKASGKAREPYQALNGAADRIETQLRRYAKRLKEHKVDEGSPYVENAGYTIFSGEDRAVDSAAAFPAVVAEAKVDIPDASVADAVMLMDLRNTGALMFRNSKTGDYNMVYRREDGNIGWVEPHKA
jgi:ribosomal subunit interface protein